MRIDFTLVANGSSDRALVAVAKWVFERNVPVNVPVQGEAADFSRMRRPPRRLSEKIERALELYPCSVLLIHRDAEGQEADERFEEIEGAWRSAGIQAAVPYVSVVPIRMTDAWFLFDEAAIRRAAGNPNGTVPLNLPGLACVESEPDPKGVLFEALRSASGLRGRRRRAFTPQVHRSRLADLIDDFAPLRKLEAFQRFENDVREVVEQLRASQAAP